MLDRLLERHPGLLAAAELAGHLGLAQEPGRPAVQACAPGHPGRPLEGVAGLVVPAQPQQRLSDVVQRGHHQARRSSLLGGAQGSLGDVERPVVPGVVQQAVGLIDQHSGQRDQVTGPFSLREGTPQVGLAPGAGLGQGGGQVGGRPGARVAGGVGAVQRLGRDGPRLLDLSQHEQGRRPDDEQLHRVAVLVVSGDGGQPDGADVERRTELPLHVVHHRHPPGQRGGPALPVGGAGGEGGEGSIGALGVPGHPPGVAEHQLSPLTAPSGRFGLEQADHLGGPAPGEHLLGAVLDQRQCPRGVAPPLPQHGSGERIPVLLVPGRRGSSTGAGHGRQPLVGTGRSRSGPAQDGGEQRDRAEGLAHARSSRPDVGDQQAGPGEPAEDAAHLRRAVSAVVLGKVGEVGKAGEVGAQGRGDRADVEGDVEQPRLGAGQIGQHLGGQPSGGSLPDLGRRLGEGRRQGLGSVAGQGVADQVHQRRPAAGELVHLVGDVDIGDSVLFPQHPGVGLGGQGEVCGSPLDHRPAQDRPGLRGERAPSGQDHRDPRRQFGQRPHQRGLGACAQPIQVVHGEQAQA